MKYDPNDDTLERELQAWLKKKPKAAGPRRKKRTAHMSKGIITTRMKGEDAK